MEGPQPAPDSWLVSLVPNDDGTMTARYAYRDGKTANMVIPANRHGEYDHATLAGFVSSPPPPPKRA